MPDYTSFHTVSAESVLSLLKSNRSTVSCKGDTFRSLLPELEIISADNFLLRRNSLFDVLPEFLFHENLDQEVLSNVDQMAAFSRKLKREDAAARRFFFPFDSLLFEFSCMLTTYTLTDHQAPLVVPEQICLKEAELRSFALQLSRRFGEQIHLSCERGLRKIAPVCEQVETDSLGETFVIGDSCFTLMPLVEVTIGPIEQSLSVDFMPHMDKGAALRRICTGSLPVATDIVWKILPHPSELCGNFQLGINSYC
ncbi:hypothetical protein [Chitinophaga sp. sic0106]|uniref:hypothetical protein n=1 Tax=Chitinophaga sp. sic0106 TaxID=2854785 RepID=UPI001C476F0F|nr:hypothetical protein [Chitinophaga sp. sic0106]MBV7532255.1 hypothetical protein [Chitinophaga sp. sic0106]